MDQMGFDNYVFYPQWWDYQNYLYIPLTSTKPEPELTKYTIPAEKGRFLQNADLPQA